VTTIPVLISPEDAGSLFYVTGLWKVSLARIWVFVGVASLVLPLVVAPARHADALTMKQTRALIESLSAKLAKQEQLSGSLVEKYNTSRVAIQQLDSELARLRAQIIEKRRQLSTTSGSMKTASVLAYVYGAADAQFLALFQQDISLSDARRQYEEQVLGNLHALSKTLKQQQTSLNISLQSESEKRAAKATEAANVRSLLAQNAANEKNTRATLATITKKLKRQIIDYQIVVAKAASKRGDTKAVAAAVAAAAAVGGQAAVNEIIAAIKKKPGVNGSAAGSKAGMAALAAAKSVIGTPYVWGGETPRYGFDCSGLMQWAWAQAGYRIPRTTSTQYNGMRHIPLNKIQPGDLLFYYNLDNDHQIDHVVMYAGSGPWGLNTIIAAARRGTNVSLAPIFTYGLIGAGRP